MIFHNDLLPAVVGPIEMVEPTDPVAPGEWAIFAQHVTRSEPARDPAPRPHLFHGEAGQRGRIRDVGLAELDQPTVGHQAVGHDLLDQFVASLGRHAAETDAGLAANGRQHRQKLGMPVGGFVSGERLIDAIMGQSPEERETAPERERSFGKTTAPHCRATGSRINRRQDHCDRWCGSADKKAQ